MKRLSYDIACVEGYPWALMRCTERVSGYAVPGTRELIAVRRTAWQSWSVTHVPTGYLMGPAHRSRAAAVAYARRLYTLAARRRIALANRNPKWIGPRLRSIYRAMQKRAPAGKEVQR